MDETNAPTPLDLTRFVYVPTTDKESGATVLAHPEPFEPLEATSYDAADLTYTYDPEPLDTDAFEKFFGDGTPSPMQVYDEAGDLIGVATYVSSELDEYDRVDHFNFKPIPQLYWHDGGDQA